MELNQYDAAIEFMGYTEEYPNDFIYKHDVGRDHSIYFIQHKGTGVRIGVNDTYSVAKNFSSFNHVNSTVAKKIVDTVRKFIENERHQESVTTDNASLMKVFAYYKL